VGTPAVDLSAAPGPTLTAVLLHPHPDMGGDRLNHVVDALYRSLPKGGFTAARFDFSSSDPETAVAETAAVVDQCAGSRVALIGYSFGAGIAVQVTDPRVLGWMLVAPYAGAGPAPAGGVDQRPKLVLVAEHDQWTPLHRAEAMVTGWANTTVRALTGADHFLDGATGAVVDAALDWLRVLAEDAG
jgi:alpha/beta superfamily hydrolase